jgi:predicted enzyme related to lactoylglutathione lyase
MLNFNSVMIGSQKVKEMAAFYEAVFEKKADMEDGGYFGWQVGKGFLTVGEHSEAKSDSKEPFRVILNFETTEVKEEFDRISKISGAKIVKEPYEMGGAWIATIADPDGNYFQLMTPWDENASQES